VSALDPGRLTLRLTMDVVAEYPDHPCDNAQLTAAMGHLCELIAGLCPGASLLSGVLAGAGSAPT
jgi:hypothetical protein